MTRTRNFLTAKLHLLGKFSCALRERWAALTVIILSICVPVYAMAWIFDVFDDPVPSIAFTAFVTLWPLLRLISPPESLNVWSLEVWFGCFTSISFALVVGGEYGWQFLSFNAIWIALTLPGCLIVWEVIRQERMLAAGFTPALIATMIYWVAGLAMVNEGDLDHLFLPLPVIFIGGAIWAPVALLILKFARRHKDGGISGPGMQVLAMTMLFFRSHWSR